MKLDEMRARLQIKQTRPKTALDESKRAEITDKARVIHEKISKSYVRDEEFFSALDERISKLKGIIEKAQVSKDAMTSTHLKDLKDIGGSFTKEIAAETNQHLTELQAAQSEQVEKSHGLQSELVHSVSVTSAGFHKKEQSLISDTETVALAFQQQRRERELFFESLIGKLGGAMLNLHERLISERSEREQTHRQRLQDIADMRHRFTKAIEVRL